MLLAGAPLVSGTAWQALGLQVGHSPGRTPDLDDPPWLRNLGHVGLSALGGRVLRSRCHCAPVVGGSASSQAHHARSWPVPLDVQRCLSRRYPLRALLHQ